MLFGQFLTSDKKHISKQDYTRITDDQGAKGKITFDVLKPTATEWNKKVVVVLAGVCGCSDDRYVQEIVHSAVARGYQAIVLNHLVPKGEASDGLKCVDYSRVDAMQNVCMFIRRTYPECDGLFGVGFSLGGNYVLKAVAAPNEQG